MNERIAIVGIIVENLKATEQVNQVIHIYSDYIEGRMGLPKVADNIRLISIVIKAPQDKISAMTGKLGMINGISVSVVYSKTNV